jgi:ClpP class serine protease
MTLPIRDLTHVWSLIYGRPHLIRADDLEPLLEGLRNAMFERGSRLDPLASDPSLPDPPRTGEAERPRGYRIDRGVATLPIYGVLASRIYSAGIGADSRPIQSYENLSRVFRSAQRDPRVRGILLDIDSPGGMADGVFALADEIHASSKPVWSIANHAALSAAYDLAAATERIWTTDTASLGSIGVVAIHRDESEADAKEGHKYTFIHSGARKLDGNAHQPLSSDAHTQIRAEVERIDGMQIDRVARWRRLEPWTVRQMEAAVYHGQDAVQRGLADRTGTLDEAHDALAQFVVPKGRVVMDDAPPPMTTEAPPDNVVQLNVAEAVQAAQARAIEVAELCALAGYPAMAAEQIRLGTHPDALRQLLQLKKVAEAAAAPVVAIDTSQQDNRKGSASAKIAEVAEARFKAQSQGR